MHSWATASPAVLYGKDWHTEVQKLLFKLGLPCPEVKHQRGQDGRHKERKGTHTG